MGDKGDGDTNCNWCVRYNSKDLVKRNGKRGDKRTSGNYQEYSAIKICQNTEKSPGDLRKLEEIFRHLNSNGKPSAHTGGKNSLRNNNNNNYKTWTLLGK